MTETSEALVETDGLKIRVKKEQRGEELDLTLKLEGKERCVLHWGCRRSGEMGWRKPPREIWPEGSQEKGSSSVQTVFPDGTGERQLTLRLRKLGEVDSIEFVLFLPERNSWLNNRGKNYQIPLRGAGKPGPALEQIFKQKVSQALFQRFYDLLPYGRLAVAVTKSNGEFACELMTDLPGKVVLHWGVAEQSSNDWSSPPEGIIPRETTQLAAGAAETVFQEQPNGLNELRLKFPEEQAPLGVPFVLKHVETNRWLKDGGKNFYAPIQLAAPRTKALEGEELKRLAEEIIQAETRKGSWTLMHRFQLCQELLDRVRHEREGMAMLFVWLRYSAIRQLTWQRNYNTKPRELSHAQDRLTQKLADLYQGAPESRDILRLMLASVGRGGEGQRIRDEILVIMHRHHIKEVSGHFLEEWHQKLHNNTTPDDIVICEAYIDFLQSNGQQERFYERLQAGGVSKQRLESFERPIKSAPDFVPHLKEALIHDFGNFLRVLKSVHAGTDLETAIQSAQSYVGHELQQFLWQIYGERHSWDLNRIAQQITEAREKLAPGQGGAGTRERLYLDLALEQLLRAVFERNLERSMTGDELVDLTGMVLRNLGLSGADEEFLLCARQWERLKALPRFSRDWSLQAKSVVDRLGRALSDEMDRTYQLLQPKAEMLGHGFGAEPWTITLFSEEVVRGGSLTFVLSKLIQRLAPLLRKSSGMGAWQIVSRGQGTGEVKSVESLRLIQGKRFASPKIILANKVTGEEEIPEGVAAVIAPDVTDLVSHVAVRARNAGVLFASCFDSEVFEQLKGLRGRLLQVQVNPAGDVTWSEAKEPAKKNSEARRTQVRAVRLEFKEWAITAEEFKESSVGGKSLNQARLRGRLPDSIRQPASVALPFGVFEQVLGLEQNRSLAERYETLQRQVEQERGSTLKQLRETVLALHMPGEFHEALGKKMQEAGLEPPSDWEQAWTAIRQVWASKWNERAYLSRLANGVPHESLYMAVLIQEVVPAEYAFVLHTVNPSTGNPEELYGEVVLGLGETLVGNHPGRALSFTWNKNTEEETVLCYPGKSIGLYGGGLICRSDSNGEDLAGYAGAGLYDSVLLNPPDPRKLDYSQEPLVWDAEFRREFLGKIAEMGLAIAEASGSPQDIEGAWVQGQTWLVQTRPQVGVQHG